MAGTLQEDDFGDFAAFRTGSPPQNNLSDDAFFSGFESNTTPQSNQVKLGILSFFFFLFAPPISLHCTCGPPKVFVNFLQS